MDGYIKLHRRILSSQVFANANALKIWIWCLSKAQYKEKFISIKIGKGETVIKLLPGQFIFGRFKAEEEICLDGSMIYRWMQKFESKEYDMISIESNNQYSIVTINNWDSYQESFEENEQPKNNQRTTNEQPTDSQRTANEHIQESKESKEECEEREQHTHDLPKNEVEIKPTLKITNDITKDPFIINRAKYEEILTQTNNELYKNVIKFLLGENIYKKEYRQLISLDILTEREYELLYKRLKALGKDSKYLTDMLYKMNEYTNLKQRSIMGVFESWLSNERVKIV